MRALGQVGPDAAHLESPGREQPESQRGTDRERSENFEAEPAPDLLRALLHALSAWHT